jgi:hypothetical protein
MVMGWWSGRHAHLQGSGGPVPSAAPGLCAHILTPTPGESIRAPFLRPLPSPLASRPGLECARYRNVTQCCTMPWHRARSTGTSRRFMPRLARRWPRCATREPQSCARTQVRSPHYSYVAHAMLISHPVLPFHPLWRPPSCEQTRTPTPRYAGCSAVLVPYALCGLSDSASNCRTSPLGCQRVVRSAPPGATHCPCARA